MKLKAAANLKKLRSSDVKFEQKDENNKNNKNHIFHIGKAYSMYQTYLWTMLIIIGGIVLVIKLIS